MAREGHFLKKKWLGPFLEEKMAGESYGGCSWMYKIIQKRWPEYILEYMLKDVGWGSKVMEMLFRLMCAFSTGIKVKLFKEEGQHPISIIQEERRCQKSWSRVAFFGL